MSACSNPLRALSRSRISSSKTLLPFLYQTATIQQWKPTAHLIARRNISQRRKSVPYVPFEGEGDLPPTIDEAMSTRKTTITGSERAAFQKLYKTFNAQGKPKNEKDHKVELDQIADEYYEDDEERSESLDKVFDAVLQGAPHLREGTKYKRDKRSVAVKAKNTSLDLNALAEEILGSGPKKTLNKPEETLNKSEDAAMIKEQGTIERIRVDTLIKNAQTDKEVLNILEHEVLRLVRNLNLDGTKKNPLDDNALAPTLQFENLKMTVRDPIDPRILFKNYPHHLVTAIITLRTVFPSSPLPLTLAPTIKALGRSSYALGATTLLYKELLRTAWLQYSSYTQIDALLTDMNNGAVEFDVEILTLLDSILKEYELVKVGDLGREMQMVYNMDMFLEGLGKLKQWRSVIAGRLGVSTEVRKARRTRVAYQSPTGSTADGEKGTSRERSHEDFRPRHTRVGEGRGRRGRTPNDSREYNPLIEGRNDVGGDGVKPKLDRSLIHISARRPSHTYRQSQSIALPNKQTYCEQPIRTWYYVPENRGYSSVDFVV